MAIPAALSAQFGFKTESTYGTAVTVDRFLPMVSEGITTSIDRVESKAKIAGRRMIDSGQWSAGNKTVAGPVGLELADSGCGLIFTHMFGTAAVVGSDPYTHTFTPGDMAAEFFTAQVGRPDAGGTVRAHTFHGCAIPTWELALSQGEVVTLGIDIVAEDEDTATGLATVSYPSAQVPFTFMHGAVSIGGSGANVKSMTITGDNGLNADRRFIGTDLIAQPLEASRREYSGSITMEYEDLGERARFLTATEFAIEAVLTAGSNTATITLNARYDKADVTVPDDGMLDLTIDWKAIGDGTDADGITAVLVNSDAAA